MSVIERYSYTLEPERRLGMMSEQVRVLVDEGVLELEVAENYLNLYVGNADWKRYIYQLLKSLTKKHGSSERARAAIKEVIACTILLPSTDRSTIIDSIHPENLLLRMPWFQQLEERDWFDLLRKTVERDEKYIKKWRSKMGSLGIIDPIEFAPLTRQAYNWLYMHADNAGAITPETKDHLSEKFKNLVRIYGGAVVTNIFTRHDDALKKVVNWRSGYFFERIIFDVYKPEQMLRIKKAELDQTSERLVTRIRTEG